MGFDRHKGSQTTGQERLIRLYQVVVALSRSKLGLTALEIETATGTSRSTLYRDLQVLRAAGIPIDCVAGRYLLPHARELPPLGLTALQVASLRLARAQLAPIAGTRLLQELDRFLSSLRIAQPLQTNFRFADVRKPLPEAQIVRTLEKALRLGRRVRVEYRAVSRGGKPATRLIEPLVFAVAEAEPYVYAYCVDQKAERTYKLARIARAELTGEKGTYRADKGRDPFAHAVKAWSGPSVEVQVRIDARVAWLAREYPLPGQSERPNADGSVTITARVAGTVEAQRRILAWGSAVEVLRPPELREAVRQELAAALGKYDGPGPVKAGNQKSTREPTRTVTQVGTGVG